jgi:hypothetical protein
MMKVLSVWLSDFHPEEFSLLISLQTDGAGG